MTLEPKIEEIARTVSNGLGQISLNVSGSDPAFYKEAEELLTKYFIEVFKSGRLQGLNEALGVKPKKIGEAEGWEIAQNGGSCCPGDDIANGFNKGISTYRDKIKSLIDKK